MRLARALVVLLPFAAACVPDAAGVALSLPTTDAKTQGPAAATLPTGKYPGYMPDGTQRSALTICDPTRKVADAAKMAMLNEVFAGAFTDGFKFAFSIGTNGADASAGQPKSTARMVAACDGDKASITIDGKSTEVDFIGATFGDSNGKQRFAATWLLSRKSGSAIFAFLRTDPLNRGGNRVSHYELTPYLPADLAEVFMTSNQELVLVQKGKPTHGIYLGTNFAGNGATIAKFTYD